MSFRREQGRGKQPNSMMQQNQPRTPLVYSQSFMMRNDLPESEPLSEYSEMQVTPLRAMPGPFRHTTAQVYQTERSSSGSSFQQMMPQATRMYQVERPSPGNIYQQMSPQATNVYQVERPSPGTPFQMATPQSPRVYHDGKLNPGSPFITRQRPTPYPQSFVGHYNSEPKFVMQSVVPSTVALPANKSVPKQSRAGTSSAALSKTNSSVSTKSSPQGKFNSIEHTRFFIGSIEQVVRWHKIAKKALFYAVYEVSAILEKMHFNSSVGVYNIILRDEQKKNVPLQASFYPIDREIPKVNVGQLVTCVGRMVGSNKLQAYDIWPTTADCLIGFQRTSYLCQRTLHETDLKTNEA